MVVRLYDGRNKEYLSRILAVPMRTMHRWLECQDDTLRQDREKKIYEMWLACYTQEEIAQAMGLSVQPVKGLISNLLDLFIKRPKGSIMEERGFLEEKNPDAASEPAPAMEKMFTQEKTFKIPSGQIQFANHADLDPLPLSNVWKQREYRSDKKCSGNTYIEFLDRLLYLYTKPHQIVIDPFCGSGITIDLCKKRHRRYWVSDRLPIPEREKEIRKADILDGPPPLHKRWSEVALLYLDPPCWKQQAEDPYSAEGAYSEGWQDLANMPLDKFYDAIAGYIAGCASKMPANSTVALIIQPALLRNGDNGNGEVADHVIALIRAVKTKYLRYSHRIFCPLEPQQCTPLMVEWAKEHKQPLILTREIIIWRRI